jgi:hypothetical protein
MSYHLVVSKYKENTTWLRAFDSANVRLYDKSDAPIGIPRPNIGRESETYLHYIVTHYHDLPDYVLFIQGHPFDHMSGIHSENFRSEVERLIESRPSDGLPLLVGLHEEDPGRYSGLCVREYFEYLFGEPCPDTIKFAAGCQYLVPKESILFHSLATYERLHAMICASKVNTCDLAITRNPLSEFDPDSMSAWTFERFGYALFLRKPLVFRCG